MAIRTILHLGDPGLREVARKVNDPATPQIRSLIEDLADTLAFWRKSTGYGRGIAAPQIGANLRVIFLKLPGEEPWPLVNPEITWRNAEKIVVWDACLSFLSIFMQVERHRDIKVRYQDCARCGTKLARAKSGIFQNSCSMKLTISMASWLWIASSI